MWSTVCNLDLSKRPTDVSLLWAETLLKAPIHIFVELKRAKNVVRKCPIFAILQQYWLIQSKYLSTKQQKCKHILLVYLSGTENQKSLFTILTDSCIHHSQVANYVRCHPVLDKWYDMIQDCQWSESYFGTKSCLSYDNCKKSSDKLIFQKYFKKCQVWNDFILESFLKG